MSNQTNKKNGKGRPIRLIPSEDSSERVLSGLMAFQRWARSQNHCIPSALAEGLREYGLELDILDLHLDETFHLVKQAPYDSSVAAQIFEFTAGVAGNRESLLVRCVKKTDNDRHTIHVRTGEVVSIHGHWMTGDSEYHLTMKMPTVANARELLLEHWITPRRWCREGRLVLIRPQDLTLADSSRGIVPTANGVTLCQCAVAYLRAAFTLLLVKGDLIRVHLPTGRWSPMLIAGLMFKEGQPQEPSEESFAATRAARTPRGTLHPPQRPDELSFIIAEKAQRRHGFSGVQKEHVNSMQLGQRFVGGMYEWEVHDVFKYVAGKWK